MDVYHSTSIVIDVFYLADLVGDCRFYAFETDEGVVVSDQRLIWQRMKKHKARIFFKLLLCFPFYFINNRWYILKLLSGMHLRTMYLFMKKIAIGVS